MTPYPNLISDSLLISETVSLLRSFGGKASAVSVVDFVMRIRKPDPNLAKMLVGDLIERDPRLSLNGDMVELELDGFENREIATTDFVVFDLETTGAKAPPCRITEIGAYRVRDGKVTEEFQTLVNPETPIPPFITGLTGISDDMVKDAPLFADVVHDFLNFIGDSVLVAHNSGFDMRFLNHEIGRIFEDYRMANPCLCTVQLSRRLLPDITNHKLKTVAEHYSIDLVNHHRASADAFATAHIFVNLLTQLSDDGVIDLAAVRDLSNRKIKYARPT
ncbi:MAG TPA: exonuclease domain-containing protein [Pyrinomonadaceae bacterium]|nr:exonuclease domain-containing protein [Pyrinomonadaceae bacterium]HQY67488.1 exonuclease domain-containing protein [Pyrinomonadaceae bacterium]HRA40002.1 exonuclease domain-containing protein [Pyrinomonadaceae bacterium]